MLNPLLIDLDGVLRIGKQPAENLQDFFNSLLKSGRKACILSNSTLSSANEIRNFFKSNFINCSFPIMTAADAALNYSKNNYKKIAVFCSEPVKSMFNDLISADEPEAVIVGDMGRDWNFEIMNSIFKYIYNGADFIAMQKNKFWKTPEDGLLLDAGAFISAIEYAAGKEALLIGKPSPYYFQSALYLLGYGNSSKFIMLGDDLETDIKGANNLGGTSILIFTGKTMYPLSRENKIKPDYEVIDLMETAELLNKLN